MDEATFVSAMADCELEDRAEQEEKKAEAKKNIKRVEREKSRQMEIQAAEHVSVIDRKIMTET